jgi:glycosyltransferase involved in cell wall biosynthesis
MSGDRPLIGVTTFGGDGGQSGISQYIIQLLRALVELPDQAAYEVLAFPDEQAVFLPASPRVTPVACSRAWAPAVRNVAWHQLALPVVCRRRRWDALFLPAANRRVPWRVPCPTVGTVHDLAAVHLPGKYDPARQVYVRHVLPRLIRGLDHVLTVSECSRQDILEHCRLPPERVTVTPLAADPSRFNPGDPQAAAARVARELGVTQPYVLYVSRLEHPGKNHVLLIRAFDRLKAREGLPHSLVLVGPDRERAAEVHQEAARARHADAIRFTGFTDGALVPDLYRAADLMLFPSLYEGFGLPLLEAMACGCPVAASRVASLPEVGGDAATYFDPLVEEELAEAMRALLVDREARQQAVARGVARAAGFSWRRTAQLTRDCLERVLGA